MSLSAVSVTMSAAFEAYRSGAYAEAIATIEASGLAGACAEIDFLQGACFAAAQRSMEAIGCFDRALDRKPDLADAWFRRGLALNDLRRHAEAIVSFDRALVHQEANAPAWFHRGLALASERRWEEAIASYDRAVGDRPAFAEALGHRGLALKQVGRLDAALASFDAAVAVSPGLADALSARGTVLEALHRHSEALAAYEAALSQKPDLFEAWYNRGNVLNRIGRLAQSLESYDRALALRPGFAPAWSNRGTVLLALGRIEAALDSFGRALSQDPRHEPARLNRGVAFLLNGDLEPGWADYEARWRLDGAPQKFVTGPWPAFAGQSLEGRTLIVHTEQGMGDCLQFARYLPLLRGFGGRILFAAPRLMHRVLRAALDGVEVRTHVAPEEPADFQCALLSLPHALGTRLETIPASCPYLRAEPDRIVHWRDRIGFHGFRVGIAWQGKPTSVVDPGRSIPLAAFAPLAAIPGVRLISLQKEHGLDQLAHWPVETLGADFDQGPDAFLDTAAAMMSLDLVVSSDTAIAHLAGALGRPVLLALKRVPDWRWMLEGFECPWYPSMRLFRQTRDGAWDDVFAAIAHEVARQASRNARSARYGPPLSDGAPSPACGRRWPAEPDG